MISHLSIRGLGPCADLDIDLDPVGITTITGPSEVGKSTLIRASTWALLGVDIDGSALDVRAIDDARDGEGDDSKFLVTRAEVSLTTKTGTVISRTITRSRSQQRSITKKGQEFPYEPRTEEDFARALGVVTKTIPVLQSQEHAARLVMVPFGWVSLTHKGGRALRDLLGQLVPGDSRVDVAALLAVSGDTLGADDPVDEKGAVAARKTANAERDTADGALREAKAAFEALVDPGAAPDTGAAQQTISAGIAWQRFEADARTHEQAIAAREVNAATTAKARADRLAAHEAEVARAADAQRDWDRRKAALGDTPKHPVAPPQTKDRDALDKLQTRIAVLTSGTALPPSLGKVHDLTRDLEAAREELRDLEAHGDTCSKCKRAGWTEVQAEIGRAADRVTALQEALAIAEDDVKTEREAAEKKRSDELADADGEREKLRARIADYDAARARYEADLAAWNQYDAARKALGERPATPAQFIDPNIETAEEPLVEPTAPTFARPTADEIATAKATINAATKAAGARDEYDRARKAATVRVERATSELESKAARAAHLDRLVDAVRRAPIERAKKQAEVLGDLGPVSFEVTPEGAEVLFDGRPEFLASHGRRIVCDLWLRAGLRRAVGMPWLPIWVDDSASWTGDWPPIAGPLVFLVTAPGELVVEHARVAA